MSKGPRTVAAEIKHLREQRIIVSQAAHIFREFEFFDGVKRARVLTGVLSGKIDFLERAIRDGVRQPLDLVEEKLDA